MPRTDPAQLILAFDCPEDWAAEALRLARATLPTARAPKMTWANYRTAAGRAFFREFEIRLSSVVLTTEEQVRDTVIHEYAHLYVFENFGMKARPHGSEWRAAMKVLGGQPKATHNYPVERKSMRRTISYKCDVCGWVLERVKRFKRNRIYTHVGCGGRFVS